MKKISRIIAVFLLFQLSLSTIYAQKKVDVIVDMRTLCIKEKANAPFYAVINEDTTIIADVYNKSDNVIRYKLSIKQYTKDTCILDGPQYVYMVRESDIHQINNFEFEMEGKVEDSATMMDSLSHIIYYNSGSIVKIAYIDSGKVVKCEPMMVGDTVYTIKSVGVHSDYKAFYNEKFFGVVKKVDNGIATINVYSTYTNKLVAILRQWATGDRFSMSIGKQLFYYPSGMMAAMNYYDENNRCTYLQKTYLSGEKKEEWKVTYAEPDDADFVQGERICYYRNGNVKLRENKSVADKTHTINYYSSDGNEIVFGEKGFDWTPKMQKQLFFFPPVNSVDQSNNLNVDIMPYLNNGDTLSCYDYDFRKLECFRGDTVLTLRPLFQYMPKNRKAPFYAVIRLEQDDVFFYIYSTITNEKVCVERYSIKMPEYEFIMNGEQEIYRWGKLLCKETYTNQFLSKVTYFDINERPIDVYSFVKPEYKEIKLWQDIAGHNKWGSYALTEKRHFLLNSGLMSVQKYNIVRDKLVETKIYLDEKEKMIDYQSTNVTNIIQQYFDKNLPLAQMTKGVSNVSSVEMTIPLVVTVGEEGKVKDIQLCSMPKIKWCMQNVSSVNGQYTKETERDIRNVKKHISKYLYDSRSLLLECVEGIKMKNLQCSPEVVDGKGQEVKLYFVVRRDCLKKYR